MLLVPRDVATGLEFERLRGRGLQSVVLDCAVEVAEEAVVSELGPQRRGHVLYPFLVFADHHVVDESEVDDIMLELVFFRHILLPADGPRDEVLKHLVVALARFFLGRLFLVLQVDQVTLDLAVVSELLQRVLLSLLGPDLLLQPIDLRFQHAMLESALFEKLRECVLDVVAGEPHGLLLDGVEVLAHNAFDVVLAHLLLPGGRATRPLRTADGTVPRFVAGGVRTQALVGTVPGALAVARAVVACVCTGVRTRVGTVELDLLVYSTRLSMVRLLGLGDW